MALLRASAEFDVILTTNMFGAILSAAMLLRHSLELEDEAVAIEQAVTDTLSAGLRTADLCFEGEDHVTTRDFTEAIVQALV